MLHPPKTILGTSFLVCIMAYAMCAQQLTPTVVASAGNTLQAFSNTAYLSFTTGEAVIQTRSLPDLSYGQGFHNSASGSTVSTTGSLAEKGEIRCYPNPVSELLYLEFIPTGASAPELQAVLYDATGRLVWHPLFFPASGLREIPVGSLDAGFYVLRLSDKDGYTGAVHFIKIH